MDVPVLVRLKYIFTTREKAVLLNDDGTLASIGKIQPWAERFDVQIGDATGTYNVYRKHGLRFRIRKGIGWDHLHIYHVGDPNPVTFMKGVARPMIDPVVYNKMLENEVLKALNTPPKAGDFLKNLNWPLIGVIILGITLAVWYTQNKGAFP